MGQRLGTRIGHRTTRHRRRRDRRVVDDAVDDHLGGVGRDLDRIGGDLGDLPGEVFVLRELFGRAMGTDEMGFHYTTFHRISAVDSHAMHTAAEWKYLAQEYLCVSRPPNLRKLRKPFLLGSAHAEAVRGRPTAPAA